LNYFFFIFSGKQKELYKLCGKLLAVSLCNGGGVGHCFSRSVYRFIVGGEKAANPDINDVCDVGLRTLLEKVRFITTLIELTVY
jgi:hypothetical protein